MLADIRYGLRQLLKHPGFTIVAVLTLALGIGANTAIFSVVNALLLKPLPFPNSHELVAFGSVDLRESKSGKPTELNSLSYADYFDFREQNRTLAHVSVFRDRSFSVTAPEGATSVRGVLATSEYFDVLGVKPAIGRSFTREDEQSGGGPGGFKVILSHDYWK